MSSPPSAARRSVMPWRPVPWPVVVLSNPTPSSETSMRNSPRAASWSTLTVMVWAWECLAAFVKASPTV